MENNRARVRINGQSYTISGQRDSEEIVRVAKYVDEKIKYIADNSKQSSASSVAVLAAVNIADELFETTSRFQELDEVNQQLQKSCSEYAESWEQSKKELEEFKAESTRLKEEASNYDNSSSKLVRELEMRLRDMENECIDLKMENTALKNELDRMKSDNKAERAE